MLTISIAKLEFSSPRLHGATIGEHHAALVRDAVAAQQQPADSVILDFAGIESATASYLKRLINPFFAAPGSPEGFATEVSPILIGVDSPDLREEITDFLSGKGRVLIVADRDTRPPKFQQLLGRLDGAAAETFQELRTMKRTTAAELYERHREETTNQTAWNNRLAQLVEMRIARRDRAGRFWMYEPTVES